MNIRGSPVWDMGTSKGHLNVNLSPENWILMEYAHNMFGIYMGYQMDVYRTCYSIDSGYIPWTSKRLEKGKECVLSIIAWDLYGISHVDSIRIISEYPSLWIFWISRNKNRLCRTYRTWEILWLFVLVRILGLFFKVAFTIVISLCIPRWNIIENSVARYCISSRDGTVLPRDPALFHNLLVIIITDKKTKFSRILNMKFFAPKQ